MVHDVMHETLKSYISQAQCRTGDLAQPTYLIRVQAQQLSHRIPPLSVGAVPGIIMTMFDEQEVRQMTAVCNTPAWTLFARRGSLPRTF
jgi:hypothetical protein